MKKSIGMRQYMVLLFTLFGIVLIFTIFPILRRSVSNMEEALISSRLIADIHYIEDLIGSGDWNLKGDYICRGDVKVGDGTREHANLEPFLLHENKTGTFSYVFKRCGDEGLTYVESTPTQAGYQQGHFLRIAGSTKDPNGNSIVGTYMDKKVADILDKYDTYDGEANVAGGMIYCRYDTLKDKNGNVIGAIVVGRNISELKSQVNHTIRTVIVVGIAVIILGCIVLFLIINRWVRGLVRATDFLQRIETGELPAERLEAHGIGEVEVLMQGINSLADTLQENKELRIISETDQLTGLANRFGLNRRAGEWFKNCIENRETISVGIMDIDYFKAYNDNYGHHEGDECIKKVATVLKEFQQDDKIFVARFGGDEFIIMTSGMDNDELEKLAEKIKENVGKAAISHAYSDVAACVTVSQGHCIGIPEEGQTLSDYFEIADDLMYEVKTGAKNGYRIKAADSVTSEEGRRKEEVVDWSTYHDRLTQLLNRDGFYRDTARILAENPDEEYYIVRSNIRNFKLVNQLFGYEKGNETLLEVADMLKSGVINCELAGRLHGDHFVFLIRKKDYNEETIHECFKKQAKKIGNSEYILQYLIGVYEITDKSMDVSIMCDHANVAIASIRSDSDNNIAYYNKSMMEGILRENEILSEFENALITGEFKVFLQPIVDAQGELKSAEALVRWYRNEDGSVVSPAEFIGVLEKAGLIHKLDMYVWEETAKILKRWENTPLGDVPISVNISQNDILYIDLEEVFGNLTERYNISHSMINLEFTETALTTDADRYIALVESLQSKGFRVEIDDFGSGYSSLNMLKDIKADVLKIDRGFLIVNDDAERRRGILASVIEMSKKLNMTVIAEGVETETQLEFLTGKGCDLFQGFYFSRPIPINEFEDKYMKKSEE